MTRAFSWKHVGIVFVSLLAAALCCLIAGNADAASTLFVVAIAEGAFGAAYAAIKRA
jgi:hypothetical protein